MTRQARERAAENRRLRRKRWQAVLFTRAWWRAWMVAPLAVHGPHVSLDWYFKRYYGAKAMESLVPTLPTGLFGPSPVTVSLERRSA